MKADSPFPARRLRGLRVAPFALLLAAAVFAVVAFLGRSSAADDHARAERALDEREEVLAASEQEEAAVAADQAETAAALAERTAEIDAVVASISERETDVAAATAAATEVDAVVAALQGTVAGELDALAQQLATGREMAMLRAGQVDAAATGDYTGFNDLQAQYTDGAGRWDGATAHYLGTLRALPGFAYDDVTSPLPARTPEVAPLAAAGAAALAPPTGPAQVVGSLPESLPCEVLDTGCSWDYELVWTETNMLAAEVQQVGERFIDRNGAEWFTVWGEEARDTLAVTVTVPAGGTETFSSWVTPKAGDPDLDGATMIVTWTGVDAEGNSFSGEARTVLQPRP